MIPLVYMRLGPRFGDYFLVVMDCGGIGIALLLGRN